jgi:hypothetical protein
LQGHVLVAQFSGALFDGAAACYWQCFKEVFRIGRHGYFLDSLQMCVEPLICFADQVIFAQRIEKVRLARYRNSAPIISAFLGRTQHCCHRGKSAA